MLRMIFYVFSVVSLLAVGVVWLFWPPVLWLLIVLGPVIALGVHDVTQSRHTILRNFPVLGHGRYLVEKIRPEIQQYFIESNIDAYPIEREMRAIVYQRAKGELETKPFGTERDVYKIGYEWASHALQSAGAVDSEPRVRVGGPECAHPYDASVLNISAMSYGALSPAAVRALNGGAAMGGFAHNTGEGGVSPYHLEPGGDLIWQIGTGYFGCRADDGGFDPEQFRETSARDQIRMIEIKLSQGAKPGHGGVLPACKVDRRIAEIRGVPIGETVISPPRHPAFSTPMEMMDFIARLRELSGGKPIGIKLCIGRRAELLSICKAIIESGISPDFVTVDGGEGGTGAAPLEFSNSMGMPARDAIPFVHNALVGTGLRDRIRVIASGKIITGFHMVRAMALGADMCNSARGMMLALGCIQALRCNNNTCPTGVATTDPRLYRGLHVGDKAERVRNFHRSTVESFTELMDAMGVQKMEHITPELIYRRTSDANVRTLAELCPFLAERQIVDQNDLPEEWHRDWDLASPHAFSPVGM